MQIRNRFTKDAIREVAGDSLSGADLHGAKGTIRISGSHHEVFATWRKEYKAMGQANGYTEDQIAEYALYLTLCSKRFGK